MRLFVDERRNQIMELLQLKKRITVKELSKELQVSEATLRTDLNMLEKENMLTRTHGGAILNELPDNETSFKVRKKKNISEKKIIAEKAYDFITEKQCILLDASSTALELAYLIKERPMRLTIITTSLQIGLELSDNPDFTLIMIGGVITPKSTGIEGTLGLDTISHLNIDLMFTSANGFTIPNGLEDFNIYEVELKKQLVNRADKVIALIDSSKINKSSSALFARLDEIDVIITDEKLDAEISKSLTSSGIKILD